jgi:hypothetical protein
MNRSTKKRLAHKIELKPLERKKSDNANDQQSTKDRKKVLAASLGKWTNLMLEGGNASASSTGTKASMKKKKSRKDVLSISEHGNPERVRK